MIADQVGDHVTDQVKSFLRVLSVGERYCLTPKGRSVLEGLIK